jgi:hypothetical protein
VAEAYITLAGFLFFGFCLLYAGHAAGARQRDKDGEDTPT